MDTKPDLPVRPRPRYQFSLRTLLIVVTAAAFGCWFVYLVGGGQAAFCIVSFVMLLLLVVLLPKKDPTILWLLRQLQRNQERRGEKASRRLLELPEVKEAILAKNANSRNPDGPPSHSYLAAIQEVQNRIADTQARNRKLFVFKILGCLCIVIPSCISCDLYCRVPNRLDFMLHGNQYEKVVNAVKSNRTLPVGQEGNLTVDGISVDYRREAANRYTITLTTADWGHFGKGGYVFGDQPPARIDDDPMQNADVPGDYWMLEEQVGEHWWIVLNNLQ